MAPALTVVIREDPRKTHRAVEALRIALGLGAGDNPMTVVLVGEAARLLGTDAEDIIDGEILEKHLPALKELGIHFIIESGSRARLSLDSALSVEEKTPDSIAMLVAQSPHTLVF